jgi:hypothetical protein
MAAGQHNDMPAHTKSYSLFSGLMKWGAILSFVLAMLVVLIVSN